MGKVPCGGTAARDNLQAKNIAELESEHRG
jgi:hypothetical protein